MVLARAGLLFAEFGGDVYWALWVLVLFLALNTVGNLRSISPKERRVMAPLTLLLAVLVAYVAASGA